MSHHNVVTIVFLSCFLVACSTQTVVTSPTESTTRKVPTSILNPTGGVDNSVKGSSALGTLLSLAEQQESKGNFQGATRILERAVRISPRNPEIYLRLAELSYRQGKYVQAQSFAEKTLSLNPNQDLAEQAEALLKNTIIENVY